VSTAYILQTVTLVEIARLLEIIGGRKKGTICSVQSVVPSAKLILLIMVLVCSGVARGFVCRIVAVVDGSRKRPQTLWMDGSRKLATANRPSLL